LALAKTNNQSQTVLKRIVKKHPLPRPLGRGIKKMQLGFSQNL